MKEASEILQIASWSLLAGEGPLWYRGYATADDAVLQAPVAALLGRWKASRLVVGHTPQRDGRIRARFGSVFLIDTGMLVDGLQGLGLGPRDRRRSRQRALSGRHPHAAGARRPRHERRSVLRLARAVVTTVALAAIGLLAPGPLTVRAQVAAPVRAARQHRR